MNIKNCKLLLAFFGPLVPGTITAYYYLTQPELTKKYMKLEWIPQLPLILIPIHLIALTYAIKNNNWWLPGLLIGIFHAILGRYYFDLPGNLWLIGQPDKIFEVAISLWIFWYLFINRTIYVKFC